MMKFLCIAAFLLLVNLSHGQQYAFNKLVHNILFSKYTPTSDHTVFYNSEGFSYTMIAYQENDSLKSDIHDYKKNQIHYFRLNKADSLVYLKTESFKDRTNRYRYMFSDIKLRNKKKTLKLTLIDDHNKKVATYQLIVEDSDVNNFPYFQNSSIMEQYQNLKIETPFNFTVLEAKKYIPGELSISYLLKSMENINLKMKVPSLDK